MVTHMGEVRYVHVFLAGVAAAVVLNLLMIVFTPIEIALGGAPGIPGGSI